MSRRFLDAYAGRSVFITGHTGFKGAWLASWLADLGARVTGYALDPPTDPSLFDALGLGGRVRHQVADVRDRGQLAAAVSEARPEVVFHLAAQPIVRQAYDEPHETFDTNVMGTVNVLDAARGCAAVRAVVVVTSDKCYQNLEDGRPFREDDPMGGRDPYSASKGCAELVTAAYRQSFFAGPPAGGGTPGAAGAGAAVASVRAGNVIGGGDWAADRIIPDCVRALAAGESIVVRNPAAVRPWQHVLEPLSGYLWLGALLLRDGRAREGAWNFGPEDGDAARHVRWVVEAFLREWGAGTWATPQGGPEQPHEAHWLSLDSAKARDRLGWAPVWDAATAVRQTAAWYRDYYAGLPAGDLVAAQLRSYESAAAAAGLPWADGEGNGGDRPS
jgi:CDP-glucose 4,6-dehydratase